MRIFRKQLFILATIFTLLASYVLPYLHHASAAENYITVAQAIANNSGSATVKGYIVGYAKSATNYVTTGYPDDNNFGIADNQNETDPTKILPVQITSGFRAEFGLKSNPTNLGKIVFVTGSLEKYFAVSGLKSPTAMGFEPPEGGGGPVDPPVDPPSDGIKISAIQGEGHDSPYKGQTVNGVEGIVTFVKDASNFYMQDPNPDGNPKTSEGILVYQKNHTIKVGDLVSVNGLVKEWVLEGYSDMLQTDLATTEIDANAGKVTVKASGQALPEALVIGKDINPPTQVVDNDKFAKFDPEEDGIDFWESIEGMRVAIENPTAVAPQRYGEVPVIAGKVDGKPYTTPGGISITKDNMNPERLPLLFTTKDETIKVKTGDRYDGTVTGVITYTFQNYKLLTDKSALPKLVESDYQREVTDIVKNADKLTVATYNMENYTKSDAAKTTKIAESIVNNLKKPDIVGLVEVQDNNGETAGGTAADQNYQALIDAIKTAGGPTYKWTDIEPVNNQDGGAPNGNIRVGYIYNPDRVSLKSGAPKGGSTEAVGYQNGSLTLNPGRIDPTNSAFSSSRKPLAAEFTFNGEDVIVINNHFNSKGGDLPIFGKTQPPTLGSEVQRMKIAGVVNNFIKDVKSKNADANIVVMGDLNDFEFSNPLVALKGNELTNLIEKVPAPERFTYTYQGNSQVLDHMLVSNNLAGRSEIDIVHLNSSFTPMHGRVSDHDPVIAQIDLKKPAKEPFSLSIMHMNDTHAALDNMPKTVTAVKKVREEKPSSLLLHAGDAFTGTLYFNEFHGQADLALMNLMKFDAMTFGNHEFDLGSSTEGHQALVNFIKEAKFPFVSANVDFSKDAKFDGLLNDSFTSNYKNGQIYNGIIKEVNGEKVGIFGLTTEETIDISSPGSIAFQNYLTKAEKAVEAFEAQGVNKIIALTHIGYDDNAAIDNDLILAEKVEGIDVIVGGHSHTELKQPVVVAKDATPTVIVQTGNSNNNLGVLNVEFDKNGVVTSNNGQLIAIGSQAADKEAEDILAPYKAQVDTVSKKEIGVSTPAALENPRTNGDNTKPSVRKNETILGNLITDAMLEKAKSFTGKNVIMALQNGGGIRAAIDAGPITVGEVITVLPFNNTLATMDVTGAELKQAFEVSVGLYPAENGGFLHVAGGKVEFDPTKPKGKRVVSVLYKNESGQYVPLQDDVKYTVATNAFTAKGGDGYDVFKTAYEEGRVTDLGLSDWENLRDHLVSIGSKGIPTSTEGRIVDVFTLTVMHTNDVHANLKDMPRTITKVKEIRSANANSLLLHAGDQFTGTLYFNEFLGAADLAILKLMGIDAMTFGNHEFDLGSSADGHQKLVDFIKGANFPFVSANVDFSKDSKFEGIYNDSIESAYANGAIYNGIVKNFNGEKVGIFGLTTEETVDISSPGSIAFKNYLTEAQKAVQALEAKGVNKIIALTHIGFDDNATVDNDLVLAEKVEGIDIIVGGHSHTTLSKPVVVAKDATPTVIVQTGNSNSNLGELNVVFNKNGVITKHDGKLIPIDSKIAEDQNAVEVLKPFKDQVDKVSNEEIGVDAPVALDNPRTNGDNSKPSVRKNETILGNMITDGMLEKAKSFTGKNVIMALQNGGGIRASIDAGPITVGEVISVLPFNNTLATMDVTGAELKEAFEISLGQYPAENGGFLHVSGGKVVFDPTKPAGQRIVSVLYLNENGKYVEVKDDVKYTVATNAFTAKGGDGFGVFAKAYEEGRVTDLGLSDWENFRDHLLDIGSEGIPTKIEGRIVDVNTLPGEEEPTPGEEEPQVVVVTPEAGNGNKYEVTPNDLKELKAGATVIVKVPAKNNTIFVSLTSETIAKLKEANATLVISNEVVDLKIPSSILPDGETEIKVQKDNRQDALVAYDFSIKSNGTGYHKFNEKVTMTFAVDPKLVKDPNKVKVFYWNPETKAWELVGGEYKDGKITATTDHFSTFGVLEVIDTKQTPVTDAKGSNPNASKGGNALPNTATNAYNYLLLGILIIGAGATIFIRRRKLEA
ncbi:5'-nucleotidase C-terminal domain-containing protein [Bacillus sp. FJAT-29814]|uniref:5'-nucleotidase C-terminal domain-containing protein n=1 Tax=Bacillus sp. FJAT-29814 TaxID=1729688 RepID=UPI000835472C|nr:5'-nucleotidase C-terminal domain-containing protein [Bacillus sp. FJAT-29814]